MTLSCTIHPHDAAAAADIGRELELHPALARVLAGRGYTTPDAARKFLHPSADLLHEPLLLPDMAIAVDRIRTAIAGGEKILVHGDYDVDGLTSTALLIFALRALKADVLHYIPNRLDEGYGLKMEGIEYAQSNGVSLIVTCDCGTSSVDEIAAAQKKGIDVIVTDHHEPDGDLPPAVAVVNPKRPDSAYPFRGLAGVGVAMKLVMALQNACGISSDPNNLMRIACLGTIADVVPLTDENRYIARHGLSTLAGTRHAGLLALFSEAGIKKGCPISSIDVGFRIAPRLNAAGRFGQQQIALDLLLERNDQKSALENAYQLNELNQKRQKTVDATLLDALDLVEGRPDLERERLLIVGKAGWSKGLVGLVASKLVERYSRPALVYTLEEGIAQGSGRSIPEFDLVENLSRCDDLFTRYGGHAMAVGFELPAARLEELRERLLAIAADIVPDPDGQWIPTVDGEAALDELDNEKLIAQYPLFEPFGYANEAPLFLARGAQLKGAPQVLKDKHLKLSFQRTGKADITALAWNFIDRRDELCAGACYDLIYSLSINSYGGRSELQIVLKDFAPATSARA